MSKKINFEEDYVITLGLPKEKFLFFNYRDVLMQKYKQKLKAKRYVKRILRRRITEPSEYDWVVNPRIRKIKLEKGATRFDVPVVFPRKRINIIKRFEGMFQ
jgi:hypothetical protein